MAMKKKPKSSISYEAPPTPKEVKEQAKGKINARNNSNGDKSDDGLKTAGRSRRKATSYPSYR